MGGGWYRLCCRDPFLAGGSGACCPRPVGFYGYVVREVAAFMAAVDPVNPLARVRFALGLPGCSTVRPFTRRVQLRSLGCHVPGLALPTPDRDDPETAFCGVSKRFLRACPRVAENCISELAAYTRFTIAAWERDFGLHPIPATADTSFRTWLVGTSYTMARKRELERTYDDMAQHNPGLLRNKSFIKQETYGLRTEAVSYKQGRGINSRYDRFKCLTGSFFHLMESIICRLVKWFVKYFAIQSRPNLITEEFRGIYWFCGTDHTAFEAHMAPAILKAVELQLYRYMLSDCPGGNECYELIEAALSGINVCQFRQFTTYVPGVRMSGDMCTSLGNGFTNYIVMAFADSVHARRHGVQRGQIRGFVEGDDGLFEDTGVRESDLLELGFELKLKRTNDVGRAGFCSMLFDSVEKVVVRDPRKVLVGFGLTDRPERNGGAVVMQGLLRAKSLSLLAECPRCPILSELARYGARVTRGVKPRWENSYREKEVFGEEDRETVLARAESHGYNIADTSRQLIADEFGISVDMQLTVESDLRNLNTLVPLDSAAITAICFDPTWAHYAAHHQVV